jgi:hypothetical protein
MHALLALHLLRALVPASIRGGDTRPDSDGFSGRADRTDAPGTLRAQKWSSAPAVLVLAAVLLAGCARGGGLEQTWPESYGTTTCREWVGEMTPHERWIASTEILMHAQRGDGATSPPAEAQIETFRREITKTCRHEKAGRLADVGLGVYIIGRSRYSA